MKQVVLTLIIALLLINSSCKNKCKDVDRSTYALGLFYSNNYKNAKDSSNHFQHNCNILLLLKSDSIEIYDRFSDAKNEPEHTVKFKLKEEIKLRFIQILLRELKPKKIKLTIEDAGCGNFYYSSVESFNQVNYSLSRMTTDEQAFISRIIDMSKGKKKTKTSKRLIREKYFMLALLHQENYYPRLPSVPFNMKE